MTFEAREISRRAGAPFEAWEITYPGTTLRWTPNDEAITLGADTYTPAPVRRGELPQGSESARSALALELPADNTLVAYLLEPGSILRGPVRIVIRQGHRGESETWVLFAGTVAGIDEAASDTHRVMVQCHRLDGLLQRRIPHMVISQKCQNMLGDGRCQVDLELHRFDTTIEAIGLQDARELEIAGLAAEETTRGDSASRFVGGVLVKAGLVAGYVNFRGSGDLLYLVDPNAALVVDDAVSLYPGDDRLITTCRERYDNLAHFNGFHLIPRKSFFDGFGLYGDLLERTEAMNGATSEAPARPRGGA